jgi:hypothetical protein
MKLTARLVAAFVVENTLLAAIFGLAYGFSASVDVRARRL